MCSSQSIPRPFEREHIRNYISAIELDTVEGKEFCDINNNYVGIDINVLTSKKAFIAVH